MTIYFLTFQIVMGSQCDRILPQSAVHGFPESLAAGTEQKNIPEPALLTFPVDYYRIRQRLQDIQNLKTEPLRSHVYRYVVEPGPSVYRDSSKRAVTLILAVLSGGIVGSGIVLVHNARRSERKKKTINM